MIGWCQVSVSYYKVEITGEFHNKTPLTRIDELAQIFSLSGSSLQRGVVTEGPSNLMTLSLTDCNQCLLAIPQRTCDMRGGTQTTLSRCLSHGSSDLSPPLITFWRLHARPLWPLLINQNSIGVPPLLRTSVGAYHLFTRSGNSKVYSQSPSWSDWELCLFLKYFQEIFC